MKAREQPFRPTLLSAFTLMKGLMSSSSAIVDGTVGCAGVIERCSLHQDILSFVYCNFNM